MPYDPRDPLGTTISCVDDVDRNLTYVSGRRALAEAVARRWITDPGELFYAPDYDAGLRRLLSAQATGTGAIAARLEAEARKDERVEACKVDVTAVGERIEIIGQLNDAQGPFTFTFTLTAETTVLDLTG